MEQAGSPLPSAPVCSPFRLSQIKAEAGLQQPLRLETQEEGGRGE